MFGQQVRNFESELEPILELCRAVNVIDFEIRFKSLLNGLNSAIAINNVLNEEYTPHTSRMRGLGPTGVPNPGRSFAISMKYNF